MTMNGRREVVARAISDALPAYMQARGALDPTGAPGHWWPNGAGTLVLADAAISAALPERTAFTAALMKLVHETHGQGGRGEAVPSPTFQAALNDVLALVYGEATE